MRFPQLLQPLDPIPVAPLTLADQIAAARSRDEVLALWHGHESEWTPDLTELAKAHLTTLA
jgi:hypothetical protein